MTLKLQLGCGPKRIPGYINIDILKESKADILADLTRLPFKNGTFDVVYSSAAIEHFGRKEWKEVLCEWNRIIRPRGKLYISTANFQACVEQYLLTKNLNELLGLLMGGQKDDYDWHGMVFDFESLSEGLKHAGFSSVLPYDWRKFDVGKFGIDDFSQAYLPHLDKENGKLMMLNLVATK